MPSQIESETTFQTESWYVVIRYRTTGADEWTEYSVGFGSSPVSKLTATHYMGKYLNQEQVPICLVFICKVLDLIQVRC